MIQSQTQKAAFTLIEMIVAIALSAMLLLLVSVISRQALRTQAFAARTAASVHQTEWLIDQFQRDISHAEQIAILSDGLWLSGCLHRDPVRLMTTQRKATIRYRVAQIAINASPDVLAASIPAASISANQSPTGLWLVREQISSNGSDFSVEPIWQGVASMNVTSDTIDALPGIDEIELAVQEQLGSSGSATMRRLPETVTVTLVNSNGQSFMSKRFRHHWEGE